MNISSFLFSLVNILVNIFLELPITCQSLLHRYHPLQLFRKVLDDKYLLSLLITSEFLKHIETFAIRMDIEPPALLQKIIPFKVLGASTAKIFTTLSGEFLKLTVLANIFAWPIAYYFMRNWLNSFAYHTEIGSEIFIGAAGIAFTFAFLTVCYQSVKAALSNPVNALRYE